MNSLLAKAAGKKNKWIKQPIEDETDSEEDELEQSTTLDENIDFGSRKVIAPICNCSVCAKARVCLLNYQTFDCSDPLADKFKAAINSTCGKHKIYI